MSSLGSREKQSLLEIARRALIAAVERRESLENLPQELGQAESAGAFVTLRRRGRLRGCIGQIGTGQPLIHVVAHCAKSAALEDPRFDPVTPGELYEIRIELSVLSPLEEIAPDRIEAGKHGLMVTRGRQRGVLLPQVASEYRWAAVRFLEETCVKAGLKPDAWREPETKIYGFTADAFSEPSLQPEESSGPKGSSKSRYSIST
jgi:uncharacterized protein